MGYTTIIATTFSLQFLQHVTVTIASDWPSYGDYDGSGEDYGTHFGTYPDITFGRCYSESCTFDKRFCCSEIMRCCTSYEHAMFAPEYEGVRKRCTDDWGHYTGTKCPPHYATDRLFCCSDGRACCDSDQMKRQNGVTARGDGNSHSGVNSIGGIAGLVFLAVIVLGTILTFITRYLKIKVRRDHARAGINSPAYIDARNRRNNNSNNNNNEAMAGPSREQNRNMFYSEPPVGQQEDEDALAPPPSYAEAVATCPVVHHETNNTDERERDTREERTPESSWAGSSYVHNPRFGRPPSRHVERTQYSNYTSIELSPLAFKNPNSRNVSQNDVTRDGDMTITLPKPEDSTV